LPSSDPRRRCRERLPDIPRWVETRDLLELPDSSIVATDDAKSFVVWNAVEGMAAIVGQPDRTAIVRAGAECPEVLAFPENVALVRAVLDGFAAEQATILQAPTGEPPPPIYPCRLFGLADLPLLESEPENLRAELQATLIAGAFLVAAFDGSRPVAFCYVAAETETFWDVSIDTVPSHRRRGFAMSAVRYLMTVMRERGKTAVWGAARSNPASLALAFRLGFAAVDELWVLSRD
jgi:GNAT superfamily N-acetyltransferase